MRNTLAAAGIALASVAFGFGLARSSAFTSAPADPTSISAEDGLVRIADEQDGRSRGKNCPHHDGTDGSDTENTSA